MIPSLSFIKDTPPILTNDLYCIFLVEDNQNNFYFAKVFNILKVQQYGLDQALQYNQEVLSDLEGVVFSEFINQIQHSIPNDGMFTFITKPYEINLNDYLRKHALTEYEALRIFDNVLKATYAVYTRGYWHKCIRPQHFVKIGDTWKLDSLVYSQDTSKSKDLQSVYTWNVKYQPPEAYERDIINFNDQQFFPIVVWNLGSLLLDLFFSVHKLNNFAILKCFKGKKFSLQSIKVRKTDLFSKKLKDILAQMLHYDPKSRMKLEQVFSNEFLSRQLAMVFKEKHKNSLAGTPIKIFTGGKSALSSALLSKQERQKGSKILPINQLVKSSINGLNLTKNAENQKENIKSLNELETDAESGGKPSLGNIFSRFLGKKSRQQQIVNKNQKTHRLFPLLIEQLFKNKQFEQILKTYKTIYDKTELLTLTGEKFSQVEYKEYQKQINLVSKFAVYLMSYLSNKQLIQDMNNNVNFVEFDQKVFTSFVNSWEYRAFKDIINRRLVQKDTALKQILTQINNLPQNQRKFFQQKQIKAFIEINPENTTFQQIKTCYRKVNLCVKKILKISYDTLTKTFNQNSQNQKLARLAMYVVFSLAIDKIYFPNLIEKNFQSYFEWMNEKPNTYIPIQKLQKYVEQANTKTLVSHAKQILQRFFKL